MSQLRFADAGYASKRMKTRREVFIDEMEVAVNRKASVRTKVEHPPRVIKRQFGL